MPRRQNCLQNHSRGYLDDFESFGRRISGFIGEGLSRWTLIVQGVRLLSLSLAQLRQRMHDEGDNYSVLFCRIVSSSYFDTPPGSLMFLHWMNDKCSQKCRRLVYWTEYVCWNLFLKSIQIIPLHRNPFLAVIRWISSITCFKPVNFA
jgi:hypothetical protein